jgi:hypothetical protein
MNPIVQVPEPGLKVCLVVLPCQPVHPGCCGPLEIKERHPEQVEVDVVEECGEPFLLPLPCGLP